MRCQKNGIEHRLTKISRSWTIGHVEQVNCTIKEATVKRNHYDSHRQLGAHLHDVVDADSYDLRLEALKGLTPFVCSTNMKDSARTIYTRSDPSDARTTHLERTSTQYIALAAVDHLLCLDVRIGVALHVHPCRARLQQDGGGKIVEAVAGDDAGV